MRKWNIPSLFSNLRPPEIPTVFLGGLKVPKKQQHPPIVTHSCILQGLQRTYLQFLMDIFQEFFFSTWEDHQLRSHRSDKFNFSLSLFFSHPVGWLQVSVPVASSGETYSYSFSSFRIDFNSWLIFHEILEALKSLEVVEKDCLLFGDFSP